MAPLTPPRCRMRPRPAVPCPAPALRRAAQVQWGAKIFALAPPTQRNLELLQRWQQLGEPDSGWLNGPQSGGGSPAEPDGGAGEPGLMFPAALEELQSAVLTGGGSILIPAGARLCTACSPDARECGTLRGLLGALRPQRCLRA